MSEQALKKLSKLLRRSKSGDELMSPDVGVILSHPVDGKNLMDAIRNHDDSRQPSKFPLSKETQDRLLALK